MRQYQKFIGIQKGSETFLFYYDDDDREALVRTLARFAADPELNLTWSDAATIIRDLFTDHQEINLPVAEAGCTTGWVALAVFSPATKQKSGP